MEIREKKKQKNRFYQLYQLVFFKKAYEKNINRSRIFQP